MLYLITEIFFSLALASLLGGVVGWWLRASRTVATGRDRDQDLRRAQSDVAKLEAKLRELGPQSMVLEPRIAELEKQKAELETILAQARTAGEASRAEIEEKTADIERLQEGLRRAAEAHADSTGHEQELRELARRAEQAEGRVSQLQEGVAKLSQRAEDAERRASEDGAELGRLRESLEKANRDAETRWGELHTAQLRVRELERELFARDASLGVLRERADHLRADAQGAVSLSRQLAAERQAKQVAVQELEALQAVHADCDFAFSTLRDQIVALRRRVGELERSAVPKPRLAVARKTGTGGEAGGVANRPAGPHRAAVAVAKRPPLLAEPSRLPDDLKRINGIGLRLEKRLNELGVYYFDQIAELSAGEAAWLDQQLGEFRGKLYRDEWLDQARDLAEGRQHVKEY
jgi:predicted flap endonuclease-1-like 5' DNA nuclease/predicted  nucleic acid-binding Zn-ribbon protein